jgi:catechol-2,3-dioxygenase
LLKERGIEALSDRGGGVWMRDRDGMLYQLRDDRGGGPARPPAQAKPKAGDTPATAPAPFAAIAIRDITLRVADLSKAAEFYENVFGVTAAPADRRQSRNFLFGDSNLRLVSPPLSTESNGGLLERLSIAVRDFSADRAGRISRDRGIPPRGENGLVVLSDPDGIAVELTAPVG